MTRRLWRNTAFAFTPVAAFGLWLPFQAQDRIEAIAAGPSQVTVSYSAVGLTNTTPDAAATGRLVRSPTLVDGSDLGAPVQPVLLAAEASDPVTRPEAVTLLASSGLDPDLRVAAWGDVRTASAIAVLVPGVGHSADEFDHDSGTTPAQPQTLPARARALYQAAADPTLAVVAWLGYHPPASIPDAVTAVQIRTGAANLAALEDFLERVNPSARTTWICHSYGSLICAAALHRPGQTEPTDAGQGAGQTDSTRPDLSPDPTALALIGSPGIQADAVTDLPVTAEVWAGRGDADFIELVGLLRPIGGGFGADPASPEFGARPIPCDPHTTHSDYFRPRSTQLAALAQIVKGTDND